MKTNLISKSLILLIIVLERLAWWNLILQFPIYLTQKDVVGGLNWEQVNKGYLYAVWAILQNFTPILLSPFIDNYGKKNTLVFSSIVILFSYLLLSFFTSELSVWFAVLLFGVFSGVFKVSTLSIYSQNYQNSPYSNSTTNSKYHWAIYILLINLGIFLIGTPFSFYLKNISWTAVFWGSAVLIFVSILLTLLFNYLNDYDNKNENEIFDIKSNVSTSNLFFDLSILKNTRYILPIILMSSFSIIYLLFYEYLPNYIFDWINTSDLITKFGVSDKLQIETSLGKQISYEWFYNLNTVVIVLLILPITYILTKTKIDTIYSMIIGLILVTLGIYFSFTSNFGIGLVWGIITYTLGEMICNVFLLRWAEENQVKGKEAQFFSLINFSSTIGYVIASIFGAFYFTNKAEKATLLSRIKIYDKNNLDIQTLWDMLKPYEFIYPFVLLGIISIIGLILYRIKYES